MDLPGSQLNHLSLPHRDLQTPAGHQRRLQHLQGDGGQRATDGGRDRSAGRPRAALGRHERRSDSDHPVAASRGGSHHIRPGEHLVSRALWASDVSASAERSGPARTDAGCAEGECDTGGGCPGQRWKAAREAQVGHQSERVEEECPAAGEVQQPVTAEEEIPGQGQHDQAPVEDPATRCGSSLEWECPG